VPYDIDYDDAMPVREEPDCYLCCDTGQERIFDPLFMIYRNVGQCPDCNATPERIAADFAEYERRRLAGELDDGTFVEPWEVF